MVKRERDGTTQEVNDVGDRDDNGNFDTQTLKNITREQKVKLKKGEKGVFSQALRVLNKAGIPYLIGAAFARHVHTGIWRDTKDLDIFLKPEDVHTALAALKEAGFETEVLFKHWLAKACKEPHFIDLIFGSGHGQISVDDRWFENSQPAKILGVQTQILPAEEMIAMACFVAERSRFDGADVVHLIRVLKGKVDWQRVLELLGDNWELLLWQLIFFDAVYPGHANYLPQDLMVNLFDKVRQRWASSTIKKKTFRGALLDPFSFAVDVEDWEYEDRRKLKPLVDREGRLK